MTTVSFSLDEETKQGIEALAKETKRSRSDVVRDMYARYRLRMTMQEMEKLAKPRLEALGLKTEEDIARYADS